MNTRVLYTISMLIDIFAIIIIINLVYLLLILVLPAFNLYIWNFIVLGFDLCAILVFLLKDFIGLRFGEKITKIDYIYNPPIRLVLLKNSFLGAACFFFLIPTDIHSLLNPMQKTPIWINFVSPLFSMLLFWAEIYWNIGLRLSGLKIRKKHLIKV
jgi:hypothetical protein